MKARHNSGFTLIEVMIVVAILGILSAIAYPSYLEHVRQSRRAECKTQMLSYASALERRFTIDNSYPADGLEGFSCNDSNYTLTYEGDDDRFTLTATPTGAQSGDSCGVLSLRHNGSRGAEGSGKCW